jgi:magnesium transporter
MITEFLTADKDETIGSVLHRLKKEIHKLKKIDYVYILNKDEHLLGVVSLRDLLALSKHTKIKEAIRQKPVSVSPDTDQEKVADLAVKHNLKAIPVTKNSKLIGIVPIEELFSILNRALREDILHLAGIHKAHIKYENTLAAPLFMSILHRIPWLIIGLFGITAAAVFIGIFEATLENYIILAFFIPAMLYMSNALGTQHQTLLIRDIAILGKDLKMKFYFFRQMLIGTSLSLIISILIFLIISIFWNQSFIALVIATSMFITLFFSSFTSLLTPLIISKLKYDPALGSGPLGAIISDVTSIIIYFVVAYLLIGL